jgi:ABC-type lipoprotein release transport system permease subunit
MLNKLNIAFLLIYRYKQKYIGIFVLFFIVVFILSSFLFVASSIKKDIYTTLLNQADIVVQRYEGGKVVDTPIKWMWEFLDIKGITKVEDRIYGRHFFEQPEDAFMIVGLDFYDETVDKNIQKLVNNIDFKKFMQKNYMIVGNGVKKFFDKYAYYDYYIFRPPDKSKLKVWFYKTLNLDSDIVSNDTIFVTKALARKILGIKDGYVSDLAITVKNKDEIEKIRQKLIVSHFNARVITKDDIKRFYENLFNYKGGVFLGLFLCMFFAFLFILYHRFMILYKDESKEIALLRFMGFSIQDVIHIKLIENLFVALLSFLVAIFFAFIYVFVYDGYIIREIFLGYKNFQLQSSFYPSFDFSLIVLLFLVLVIPFLITVIYPVFKLSTIPPSEIIK